MDPVLSKYQRDLNCTADPDRSTRTRALKKLDEALFGRRADDLFEEKNARCKFLVDGLMDALVQRLSDPIEKNRELALSMLKKFVEEDENGAAKEGFKAIQAELMESMAARLVECAAARVGEIPFPEESEEIRLLWSELLGLIIVHPNSKNALKREMISVVRILAKSSTDSFPDNKRQCAENCLKLSDSFPDDMHLHLSTLLTPLSANASHQHSKVRQLSLDAIKHLALSCAATSSTFEENMREKIIPILRAINHDRASAVRIQGMHLVSDLMLKMPNAEPYRKDLLPIVLFGLADTARQIQELTLETIERVGMTLTDQSSAFPVQDAASPPTPPGQASDFIIADFLPEPFTNRPGPGARSLVVGVLPAALPTILKEAEDWTAQERFRAVSLLRSMLVYAEASAQPFVNDIVNTLVVVAMDDEQNVREVAQDCAKLLGRYTSTKRLLEILVPMCISTKVGDEDGRPEDASLNRLGALSILSSAVLGFSTSDSLMGHLTSASTALGDPALCDGDNIGMQGQLLIGIQSILERYIGGKEILGESFTLDHRTVCTLLRTLLVLRTNQAESGNEVASDAEESISLLAVCSGHVTEEGEPDVQKLAESCAELLLNECVSTGSEHPSSVSSCITWTKFSPNRRVFDEVVRRTGLFGLVRCGKMDMVIQVLAETCPVDRDPDLRLSMLSLLESLISFEEEGVHERNTILECYASTIVDRVLFPGLVWRVGRVASTIRKMSMYCFSHFVSSNAGLASWFHQELPRIMPTLKACLDDMEADTRRFTCVAFTGLFNLFLQNGKTLEHLQFADLYHDVIKRWDDADDRVRLSSCVALEKLILVSPIEIVKGTPCDYITDISFIHMDDTNQQIKEAVFAVVKSLIDRNIDVPNILTKAQTHRTRHRSPDLCDTVIALCQAKG